MGAYIMMNITFTGYAYHHYHRSAHFIVVWNIVCLPFNGRSVLTILFCDFYTKEKKTWIWDEIYISYVHLTVAFQIFFVYYCVEVLFYICLLYSFELLINRKFPKLQRIKSKSNLFCLGNGFASINSWQTWNSTHPACQRRTPRTRQTRCRGGRRWCCLRRPRPWWRSQASCLPT